MNITIKTVSGKDITPYIDTIAKFRLTAFKEFPYLYQGDLANERKYLEHYPKNLKSLLVLALQNNEVVGFLTGVPLAGDFPGLADIQKACEQRHLNPQIFYYYGEGIIKPAYQGKGLFSQLMAAQELQLKKWGFKHSCFLTVKRDKSHPLKPKHYSDPSKIWRHKGFQPFGFELSYNWPTILSNGKVKNHKNKLMLWVKTI